MEKIPRQMKQSKITAFWCGGGRKRKNVAEVPETPEKKLAMSPDLFQKSPEKMENLFFDADFENDPFLSPRKVESPKKKVLGENFLANESWKEKSDISFETPVKCKVEKSAFVTNECFEQVLVLLDCTSNAKGVAKLRDVWTSFPFSTGDIVSIRAAFVEGGWVVDNKNGFVVLFPDVLVSSTTLTSSMFCMRRGVLANFFRDIDSQDTGKMLIGRLVHELFQEALQTRERSEEKLNKSITDSLNSRENLHDIFFSGMKTWEIDSEMRKFIPSLRDFFDVYVDKRSEAGGRNFGGSVEGVLDIEELIQSPALGFRGRVDVTVRVRSKEVERTAPLELKTGKASFSNQHRSQLSLYVLLMNELGRQVESGLLLYLRDNMMEEVVPARDEIRNLFLLRNHFVGFCRSFGQSNLPEPIRNVKCCTRCSYLKVCATYLRGECDKIPETHPVRSIEIPDVKPSHVDYFLNWNEMLLLEFESLDSSPNDNEMELTLSADPIETYDKQFTLHFLRNSQCKNIFSPGTFVQIIDGKNNRIAGQVIDTTDSTISVSTEKPPSGISGTCKLVATKAKFLEVYLSNLGWLLKQEFENLRELIIDKKTPQFEKKFDKTDFEEKCLDELLKLNKEQRKAILKSLLCRDYLLIKGPPGTGKTQTIVTLVKLILAFDKNVLIAGHTHSSVDNILLRLNDVEYLRLGSLRSIHEDVRPNSYSALRDNCSSVDDIQKLFDRKVIASTCLGIEANIARKLNVEYCILDESSQILQPEALRPLFCCRKFILVGDENQLPPVVRNAKAKALAMGESLFERLASDQATVQLRLQYRMNSVINALANAVTYKGGIECASEEVAGATMKVLHTEEYNRQEGWIAEVLSKELEKSVVFVDTSEYFRINSEHRSDPRSSSLETNIVVKLVSCLVKLGLKRKNIGVISPFQNQICLLKRSLKGGGFGEIEVNTIDQYQGRDKEVIVVSCGKENRKERETSGQEILSDERRITVAVTRAKHKLIMVGDRGTVVMYEPLKKLLGSLKESQVYCLSDGRDGFFWGEFDNKVIGNSI